MAPIQPLQGIAFFFLRRGGRVWGMGCVRVLWASERGKRRRIAGKKI
jgi:hypothetical protein